MREGCAGGYLVSSFLRGDGLMKIRIGWIYA